MPKNKKRNPNVARRGINANSIVPFKFTITNNYSSSGDSNGFVDLALGNMGPRMAAFINLFKKWRLNKLHVKMVLDSVSTLAGATPASSGVVLACAFLGSSASNVSAAPAQIASVMDLLYSDCTNGFMPGKFTVPRSTLHESANSDWLACSTSGISGQVLDYTAGSIVWDMHIGQTISTGSVRQYIFVSGVAEFCEPTDPAIMSLSLPYVATKVTSEDEEKIQSVIQKATPKSELKDPKLTAKEMTQLHFLLGRLLKGQRLPDMESWADELRNMTRS
jgi:hypothetical protein